MVMIDLTVSGVTKLCENLPCEIMAREAEPFSKPPAARLE
jgi:hypothetical protein